jgi:hypothetical protein
VPNDPPSRRRGAIAVPAELAPVDERQQKEDAAIADVEARVRAGTLSGTEADAELLEIALGRFDYLPPDAIEELRSFGRELNEEPEMVETRLGPETGEEEESPGEGGP